MTLLNNTSGFDNTSVGFGTTNQTGTNPSVLNPTSSATSTDYNVGQGMETSEAEALGTSGCMPSTRWHSQSRKSLLLHVPEHLKQSTH